MRLVRARFPSVRTVFARFVIHYVVLLLVLSCVGAFLYHRSVQYAEKEAMESGLAKLDKTRELVDARLKEVESLTTQAVAGHARPSLPQRQEALFRRRHHTNQGDRRQSGDLSIQQPVHPRHIPLFEQ
ncbi:hypothetical protein [Cohnella rhizosphaerae]|uniref:Uncharacterized protein n=1 Tax=Cohnella rhizosphaerae TaxID=1457232 RepID=A0A9X4KQE7_9BACL|nr:hypothetical protein [Cohnella rhizosphaerae]MDG0809224.1 hypothetical protein [Cohnella rhizosphaerae]